MKFYQQGVLFAKLRPLHFVTPPKMLIEKSSMKFCEHRLGCFFFCIFTLYRGEYLSQTYVHSILGNESTSLIAELTSSSK